MNCATCVQTSKRCTSCTYINTISIVYLYNFTCIVTCPNHFWPNSTVDLDHQCSPCNSYCLTCTGPTNFECSVCGNATIVNGGSST